VQQAQGPHADKHPHADKLIRETQMRIDEQKARLHRLIVQGHPTQSADDILSAMYVELRKLQQLRLDR
jgi:hypothetical protein